MLRIAQISDPHIGDSESFQLAGVNTLDSFRQVLHDAVQQQPHLIVVSGDIAADPHPFAYEAFFDSFRDCKVPMLWLPGNHDSLKVIHHTSEHQPYKKLAILGGWRLFLLNSSREDQPEGEFLEEELEFLRTELPNSDQPTLIFLHHHPIPMGSAWLDQQMVRNAAAFHQIVSMHAQVKGIFWGHVHQAAEIDRNGCLYASTPSTCIQFKRHSDHFALSSESPGYRLIDLDRSGKLTSQVKRVHMEQFCVDTRCVAY